MRLKALLVTALALTVVLAPGAPAQAAAPTAYHTYTQFLEGEPEGNEAATCRSKNIFLKSGKYDWGENLAGTGWTRAYVYRTIDLREADYKWTECLFPSYDPWGDLPGGYYRHTSRLEIIADGDTPPPAVATSEFAIGFDDDQSQWVIWGSFLDPLTF